VTNQEQQDNMYKQIAASLKKPYPSVEGIKMVLQLFTYRELQRHKPEDFYDASLVAELDKSGFRDITQSCGQRKKKAYPISVVSLKAPLARGEKAGYAHEE